MAYIQRIDYEAIREAAYHAQAQYAYPTKGRKEALEKKTNAVADILVEVVRGNLGYLDLFGEDDDLLDPNHPELYTKFFLTECPIGRVFEEEEVEVFFRLKGRSLTIERLDRTGNVVIDGHLYQL